MYILQLETKFPYTARVHKVILKKVCKLINARATLHISHFHSFTEINESNNV